MVVACQWSFNKNQIFVEEALKKSELNWAKGVERDPFGTNKIYWKW